MVAGKGGGRGWGGGVGLIRRVRRGLGREMGVGVLELAEYGRREARMGSSGRSEGKLP